MKFFDIFRDDEEPSFRELALEGHIQKALIRYANGKEEEMEAIRIGLQAILKNGKKADYPSGTNLEQAEFWCGTIKSDYPEFYRDYVDLHIELLEKLNKTSLVLEKLAEQSSKDDKLSQDEMDYYAQLYIRKWISYACEDRDFAHGSFWAKWMFRNRRGPIWKVLYECDDEETMGIIERICEKVNEEDAFYSYQSKRKSLKSGEVFIPNANDEWTRKLIAEWRNGFEELRQSGELDKFVEEAEIGPNSDALDPFGAYLGDAIGNKSESEWRPVLEAYEKLLRRLKQEHNVDLRMWHYWWDLIKRFRSAGDAEKAADLSLEMLLDDNKWDHYEFDKLFKSCLDRGDTERAIRVAELALNLMQQVGDSLNTYEIEQVSHWFERLEMRSCFAECLELSLRSRKYHTIEEWQKDRKGDDWPRLVRLYDLAGNIKKAVELCREIGRTAKAERLLGKVSYSVEEIDFPRGKSKGEAIAEVLKWCDKAHALYDAGKKRAAAEEAEQSRFGQIDGYASNFHSYYNHLGVALIYKEVEDHENAERILTMAEEQFKEAGRWQQVLGMYFDAARLDDLERVAREEDELECAVIAYEAAGKPGEAARIYEEMAEAKSTEGFSDSEEEEIRKCPCGEVLQRHWKACPACGKNLDMICSCGEPLEKSWKICPNCEKEIGS